MVALQPGPSLAGSSSRQTGRDLARRPAVESGQAGGSREGAQGEDAVLKRGPGAVVLCHHSHFCGSRRSRPNHVCTRVRCTARVCMRVCVLVKGPNENLGVKDDAHSSPYRYWVKTCQKIEHSCLPRV